MIQLIEHKLWWNDIVDPEIIREGVLRERFWIEAESESFDGRMPDELEWRDCNKWQWEVKEIGGGLYGLDEEWLKENAVFENEPPLELLKV